ncbi:MAG: hypothetical protein ABI939_11205 [Anaerolineaceae bacterium]
MTSDILQFLAALLASSVEMVEALTIVLAVGVTRSWRPALLGVGAGLVSLTIVVVVFGPSLVNYVPIDVLRVTIGTLLLIFGLQWLRKAVLRSSGLKAKHDEAQIYEDEVRMLRREGKDPNSFDWTGFTVAFKGVFLEGLEVAFIVLTFGANEGRFDLPIAGASVGLILVVGTGLIVHKPLSRVPENTIKYAVGLLLSAFGTFWVGEGVGVEWTLQDPTIVALVAAYATVSAALVWYLKPKPGLAAPVEEPVA